MDMDMMYLMFPSVTMTTDPLALNKILILNHVSPSVLLSCLDELKCGHFARRVLVVSM